MRRDTGRALLLLLAAIGMFASVYAAVSSEEAVKFVTAENQFLHPNEQAKQPNYKILDGKDHYWVIPVVVDEEPVTYFAVGASEKKLVTGELVNRRLFKTADVLREFLSEKDKASKNTQVKWVVTGSYARIFENLARMLSDDAFALNTIASTANDPQISNQVSALKSELAQMSGLSKDISAQIDEATAFESAFTTEPDTAKTEDLKKEFEGVFTYLFQLEDKALDYRSKVSELKREISLSNAEADAKTYMIKLAEPPDNFNEIGNLAISGTQVKDVIEKVYVRVEGRMDNFVSEFNDRLGLAKAYAYLYGANDEVAKVGNFKDLRTAVTYVIAPENKAAWQDQAGVAKLEETWRNAENSYKQGNYDKALIYAKDALKLIDSVQRKGVLSTEKPPLFSDQLLQQAMLGLGGLLVLVFLFKNRSRLGGFLKPGDGQESEGDKLELGWKNA